MAMPDQHMLTGRPQGHSKSIIYCVAGKHPQGSIVTHACSTHAIHASTSQDIFLYTVDTGY